MDSTIIDSDAATTVTCAEGAVRVSNLTIRQQAEDASAPCFAIEVRGRTEIVACHVTARCRVKNSSGVLARGAAAAAILYDCAVRDCGHAGLLLASGARATLMRTEVRCCMGIGIVALAGCVLDAQGGCIVDCDEGAVAVLGRAAVSLSSVKLASNGGAAGAATVSVRGGGRISLKECEVRDARGMGVQLADGAEGSLSGCSILGSAKAGISDKKTGLIQISGFEISNGRAAGIMLLQPSTGGSATNQDGTAQPPLQVLKGNTIRANAKAGVQISAGASPIVEQNRIVDGAGAGLYVFGGSRPTITGNVVQGNGGPALKVEDSAPSVEQNTFCLGADVGVLITGRHTSLADTTGDTVRAPDEALALPQSDFRKIAIVDDKEDGADDCAMMSNSDVGLVNNDALVAAEADREPWLPVRPVP